MAVARSRDEFKAPFLIDTVIVGLTFALIIFSIVMIYSTTGVTSQERFGDALFYVKRQGFAAILGLALMYGLSKVSISKLQSLSPILLPIVVLLLTMTLIPGLGDSAGGAKRWILIGPMRFQPGEMVKLMTIIFMAGFFARHDSEIETFMGGIAKPFLLVLTVCGLFLMQPDFGSSVIIAGVTFAMAGAAGCRLRYLFGGGLALAAGAGLLVVISPYRMSRIINFMAPWSDASGKGYQLIQSLIAVGTGNFYGVGLGASQQKLFFLPAAHTDFIFAVIAEELGFVGCLALIVAFLLFLWRGLVLARSLSGDTFRFCLAIGLTLLVVFPAFLNIGVVTGVLPTKGLVLPLIGYGGSSLVASLAAIGLLLALARERNAGS